MYYFAYGSNLSIGRFTSRLPSALVLGVARLSAHRLVFHKKSSDGSAKCDALSTDNVDDEVIGVVYEITAAEKCVLDTIEERGYGYKENTVNVDVAEGKSIEALAYFAMNIDASLKPYHWYKEHVLIGAREHGLPTDYVQMIEQVESISDPMPERHARELQVYS